MKTPIKFCFCGSSRGCSLSKGLILCNTYTNAQKDQVIKGYKCIEENPASFKMMGVVR